LIELLFEIDILDIVVVDVVSGVVDATIAIAAASTTTPTNNNTISISISISFARCLALAHALLHTWHP